MYFVIRAYIYVCTHMKLFRKENLIETHPHSSTSGCSVDSMISSSKIRSSPPNTDISRRSAALRVPPSEFHVRDSRRSGCEETTSPAALDIFSLSLSLFLAHLFASFFLVRLFVRSFVVRSLVRSPDRPRTPPERRRGQTTRVLSNTSPFAV